ncbi:MAG: hypothetical protein RDV41_01460 [Planctomycetota bacterium]|nr:hypothetical protein [Planctomycetota bacterium]
MAIASLESSGDAVSFKAAFNSFLNSCRAITYALQKEGKGVSGFEQWYKAKQVEMGGDELLRFFHDARVDDFHKGEHKLTFTVLSEAPSPEAIGPSPFPGAQWRQDSDGFFWIVDAGTPNERRIPSKPQINYNIFVSVAGAPTTHMGKKLADNSPTVLCKLCLDYCASLVHEARELFSNRARALDERPETGSGSAGAGSDSRSGS